MIHLMRNIIINRKIINRAVVILTVVVSSNLSYNGSHPSFAQGQLQADGVLGQAQNLLINNQAQQALPLIASFINLRPQDPQGYYWQGIAFDALDLPENAYLAYGKSIEQAALIGMDSAELRVDIGNVLFKMNRLDEAIVNYERALEIDPKLVYGYLNLSRALIEKADYVKALNILDKASELKGSGNQLSYYRAKALVKSGKNKEALEQVQILLGQINNEKIKENIKREFVELH